MRGLLAAYKRLTHFLGDRRRFVRRLAGLCLIVMGVHAAANHIDNLAFGIIDALDLWIDHLFWSACDGAASLGAFSASAGNKYAQNFASAIDLDQKANLSTLLALTLELGIDLLLVPFAWGTRPKSSTPPPARGLVGELKESAQELAQALWPLDLERLAMLPILIALTCAGTFMGALAIEGMVASTLGTLVPLWRWGINLSAATGLLAAALLQWRFLPDLLHGAILKGQDRAKRFATKQAATRQASATASDASSPTRLSKIRQVWQRWSRGWFFALVVLPLAVMGLLTQSAFLNLVARTGANL